MNQTKTNLFSGIRLAGAAYLICMITSIVGGSIIDGIISDTTMYQEITQDSFGLIFATAFELINAFGVLMIAIVFYHIQKKAFSLTASTYLILRVIEGTLCILIAFIPILLLMLARSNASKESTLLFTFILLVRELFWSYIYPIIFSISGLLFYSMLYKSRFVPRYISIWGGISLFGVLVAMLMPEIKFIPGIFIILNEIYLGVFLLVKGDSLTKDHVN